MNRIILLQMIEISDSSILDLLSFNTFCWKSSAFFSNSVACSDSSLISIVHNQISVRTKKTKKLER